MVYKEEYRKSIHSKLVNTITRYLRGVDPKSINFVGFLTVFTEKIPLPGIGPKLMDYGLNNAYDIYKEVEAKLRIK